MRKTIQAAAALAILAAPTAAAAGTIHVSGTGTIYDGRTFVVNAIIFDDGTVSGQATLINRNFKGTKGNQAPYMAHITLSCANKIDDSTYILGGVTQMTNDSNLDDAVFFSVRDNGSDGDQVSYAYFWDSDPGTLGDPMACMNATLADEPLEDIQKGNIRIK